MKNKTADKTQQVTVRSS